MEIPLSQIAFAVGDDGAPLNPRRRMDTADLQASLREEGQIEPIIVTQQAEDGLHYVIAGHRRVVAARALGWPTVRAEVREVASMDPAGLLALMLAAQEAEPHDPVRVAEGIKVMLGKGYTVPRVARIMAMQPRKVRHYLALLDASGAVQHKVRSGQMTMSAFGVLASQPRSRQEDALQRVEERKQKAGDKPKRGRPKAAVGVEELRRAVREIAAEESPRLLDDESAIADLMGMEARLRDLAEAYAGGIPANVAWRIKERAAGVVACATALLERGVT